MRMLGAWGMTLALVLGVSPAFAGPDEGTGDGSDKPQNGGNWLTRWFIPAAKPPEKTPAPKDAKKIKDSKDDAGKGPHPVEEAAGFRARELARYFRRESACDKLKEIADLTDDAVLRKRAEELDARAWEVYIQRTAHLPAAKALFDSDATTLEKHLGQIPAAPVPLAEPTLYTVPGEKARGQDKEERR